MHTVSIALGMFDAVDGTLGLAAALSLYPRIFVNLTGFSPDCYCLRSYQNPLSGVLVYDRQSNISRRRKTFAMSIVLLNHDLWIFRNSLKESKGILKRTIFLKASMK